MKGHRVLLGALAVTALALAPACRNTAEGMKVDTRQNAEKVRDEVQKAGETGRSIGNEAKDVGAAIKEGAKEVASDVGTRKQTVDVKAALMVARGIDASHIDVDTDAETKTVTLKGIVPTAAQKAAAERVARDTGPRATRFASGSPS